MGPGAAGLEATKRVAPPRHMSYSYLLCGSVRIARISFSRFIWRSANVPHQFIHVPDGMYQPGRHPIGLANLRRGRLPPQSELFIVVHTMNR